MINADGVIFAMIVLWMAGLVIARGVLETVLAIFPPVAWYLAIQRFLEVLGVV